MLHLSAWIPSESFSGHPKFKIFPGEATHTHLTKRGSDAPPLRTCPHFVPLQIFQIFGSWSVLTPVNGRWFLQIVDIGNFNIKLNGRWFPQIVDRDSGNLYPIYINKVVVLACEPVGGRSRATELPCFSIYVMCTIWLCIYFFIVYFTCILFPCIYWLLIYAYVFNKIDTKIWCLIWTSKRCPSDEGTPGAPSNVKMPLYVKR